ncbi:hypothetical protein ACFLRC_04985, partial [Candidatus Altiarchaeota archaeon]
GFGPGWCDWSWIVTCEDDCFACWDQWSCENVGNPTPAAQEIAQKAVEDLGAKCEGLAEMICRGTEGCIWAGSECVAEQGINPLEGNNTCVWDDQWWVCKPNVTLEGMGEICFIPGDEDNDDLWDCADDECSMDPFCGFGFAGPGGGIGGGMNVDCWQWDEINGGNETMCLNGTNMSYTTGCCWHEVSFWDPMSQNETTEWLCDPCFIDQFFEGMQDGAPTPLMPPDAPCNGMEDDVNNPDQDWIDICDLGIKETDDIYGFIIHVIDWWPEYNGTQDLVLCNYMWPDSQNQTGKYYYYLDTDTNESSGCNSSDGNFTGLEYMFAYEVSQVNNSLEEVRYAKRCTNTSQWVYMSATLSGKKEETCEHNGIYLAIDKGDLGNLQADMRICASTANESTNETNPVDMTDDCVYYTPGAMDFTPPDCFMDPTQCGSGFGGNYMAGEDCIETPEAMDEDGDGFADCDDPDCSGMPWCMAQYECWEDTSYPKNIYNTVDAYPLMAFINWMNTEPTNGSVLFYNENDTCEGNYTNVSGEDFFAPFHSVALDPNHPETPINITNGSTYYYKTRSCDQACTGDEFNNTPQPNCAVSACLSFDTPAQAPPLGLGYSYQPPSQNPTDPLGRLQINMDCDGDGESDFDIAGGNASTNATTNCTIEFGNNQSDDVWCLRIYEVDLMRAFEFDMTDAFYVNETNESNETEFIVGLDSSKWNELVQNLGANSVGVCLPNDNVSECGDAPCSNLADCSDSTASLVKCDNFGENCENVTDDSDVILCNATEIDWMIPASIGFSSYGLGGPPIPPGPTTTTAPTTTSSGPSTTSTSSTSTTSTITTTTCPIGKWCLPDYLYSGWNLISLSITP